MSEKEKEWFDLSIQRYGLSDRDKATKATGKQKDLATRVFEGLASHYPKTLSKKTADYLKSLKIIFE